MKKINPHWNKVVLISADYTKIERWKRVFRTKCKVISWGFAPNGYAYSTSFESEYRSFNINSKRTPFEISEITLFYYGKPSYCEGGVEITNIISASTGFLIRDSNICYKYK